MRRLTLITFRLQLLCLLYQHLANYNLRQERKKWPILNKKRSNFRLVRKKKSSVELFIFLSLYKADNPRVLLIFTTRCSCLGKQQQQRLELLRVFAPGLLFAGWMVSRVSHFTRLWPSISIRACTAARSPGHFLFIYEMRSHSSVLVRFQPDHSHSF